MRMHQVHCLLMGGQACVLYGAAECSRVPDLAIPASDETTPVTPTHASPRHRTPLFARPLS